MRVGLAGSSLNNRDYINGSATPMLGMMETYLRRGDEVFWIERHPDGYVRQECPATCLDSGAGPVAEFVAATPLDVLILQNYAWRGKALATAYAERGTCVVLLDDNVPKLLPATCRLAASCHLVLSHGEGPARLLREALPPGIPVHAFLPATDAERFRPEPAAEFASDVTFIGAQTPLRNDRVRMAFLEPAKRLRDHQFTLYGLGWDQWKTLRRYPVRYAGWLRNQDLHKAFSSARLAVHATTRRLRGQDLLINRIVDAMACGVPLMADEQLGLGRYFAVGEEVVVATSTAEAADVQRQLLADPALARQIGQRGREAVLREHTWDVRLAQLDRILTGGQR